MQGHSFLDLADVFILGDPLIGEVLGWLSTLNDHKWELPWSDRSLSDRGIPLLNGLLGKGCS